MYSTPCAALKYVLQSVILAFCIILCVFFHYRLIRISSPNLNYIIGLGAIVLYLNIIVLVIPAAEEEMAIVLCNVSTNLLYNVCVSYVNDEMESS